MEKRKIFLILSFLLLVNLAEGQAVGQTQVCAVINWVRSILMLIIVAMVVFSGYQIMTAGGDTGRLEQAKTRLLFALVGGAVIYAANNLVVSLFGISC